MATQTSDQTSAAGQSQAALAAASSKNGQTKSSRAAIAQNFDSFLLLLTTQLKNQSPLDPLNTNEFTQQLVQFASVEQQLKSNETLNALLTSVKATTASSAFDLIGASVTADGSSARLKEGGANWRLTTDGANIDATITISDRNGSVVATDRKVITGGSLDYAWDGRTSTGTLAPEGDYTISIVGKDATNRTIPVRTEVSGKVDSVDMSEGTPVLVIGNSRIGLDAVKTVKRQPQTS